MSDSDLTNKLMAAGLAWLPASLLGEAKDGIVNVLEYGAIGNGVTDDTAAIQAAALSLTNGGILLFPGGMTFLVNATIAVQSNTTVQGYGATLLAGDGFPSSGLMLGNKNRNVTVLTDHDISVMGLTVDFGTSNPGGGSHGIHFSFVQNVSVVDCTIQCRKSAGDAVTFIGCYNSVASGCFAYYFRNCAYDWFYAPKYGRCINCYAETDGSAQMVAVNPEEVTETQTGLAAVGFIMTGCTMNVIGSHATVPIQIEPIIAGNTVSDVVLQGNTFTKVSIVARGATSNMVISNNLFDTSVGGNEVIRAYGQNGGAPSNFVVSSNTIISPDTTIGNSGVIRIQTNAAVISGNMVIGTPAGVPGIATSTNTPIVIGNYVDTGLVSVVDSTIQTGLLRIGDGASFGSQTASGAQDLSKHIALFGTSYGFCITSNALNYNSSSNLAAHVFYGGSTQYGYINGTGLNGMNVGAQSAGVGTFTQLNSSLQTKLASGGSDTIIGKEAAIATNSVVGFALIPFCAGQPTGTPTNAALGICLIYDTTNHKLWGYDNGTATWKGVAFS